MSRKDGRIEPGQRLSTAISARAWNRTQDAADIVLGGGLDGGGQGVGGPTPPYTHVYCRNSSGSNVARWGVLAISGVAITPTSTATDRATTQFEEMPVLTGVTPTRATGDQFCIAIEPIGNNEIGRVAVAGVVQCKLDVVSATDTTAEPKDGSLVELRTGGESAVVLWKEPGTGPGKWALVRLGGGKSVGGGVRLGTISATWTKGTTATVTQQNGDGTAISGSPTFTARNWFATVTVTSGTKRVACALVDSTWILIAAEC